MQTRVIKLDSDRPNSGVIKEAARLLDAGGLVAFPTETVYGIGCRAEAKSLERLCETKQRKGKKSYTVHIGQKNDVGKYVPRIGLRAGKLIKRAWPGPVTIVFELGEQQIAQQRSRGGGTEGVYEDNSIGIRCPDNRIASMLLRRCRNTIVAPSANISGQSPSTEADEVIRQLDGRIDVVLDGGPCRYKKSSTVVKLGKTGWQILRQGVYSIEDIEALSSINILFVCTGNTCRSPMAVGLCRKYLAEKFGCDVDCLGQMGYKITSAGVMAISGAPASREAVTACTENGIDITRHRSKPLSDELIAESDYIFVMSQSHRRQIVGSRPEAALKCRLLAEDADVPDPIGQSVEVYKRSFELIQTSLKKRISELVL